MDRILFEYCVKKDEGNRYLSIDTYINNERIFPKLNINIFCLDNSLKESGEYPLFVCGCGDEGCGGVFRTPYVEVEEERITWFIYEPEQREFTFDKEQLTSDIRHLKRSLLNYRPSQNWYNVHYTALHKTVGYFLKCG